MAKIGNVAKCANGKVGLILIIKRIKLDERWYYDLAKGISLEPNNVGGAWQSSMPEVIAETLDDWAIRRAKELKAI